MRLWKKLTTAGLLSAAVFCAGQTALKADAASYKLTIDGTTVTDGNKNDILGNGVFSYTASTQTLYINGSYNATKAAAINSEINGLTINVETDSVVTSKNTSEVLLISGDTTITGGRKLTLKQKGNPTSGSQMGAHAVASYSGAGLTVREMDLTVQSSYYGAMYAGTYNIQTGQYDDNAKPKLTVIDSDVVVEDLDGDHIAINNFRGGIELQGCSITTPSDYLIQNGTVYTPQGEYLPAYSTKVVITCAPYDLKINGTDVKGSNCSDVLGDGVFRYSNKSKRLFIEGDCAFDKGQGIVSKIPGLKIYVMTDSRLSFTQRGTDLAAVDLYQDTMITGSGKLTVSSPAAIGILVRGCTLTVKEAKVDVNYTDYPDDDKSFGGIMGYNSSSSKLVVSDSVLAAGGSNVAVSGFLKGITLNGSYIAEPVNGVIQNDAVMEADSSGYAKKVRIEMSEKLDPRIFSLSKTRYEYTGRQIKVGSYLRWGSQNGRRLKYGEDFTLEYENNIECGVKTAEVKVRGIGRYKGSIILEYTIVPKKQAVPKLFTKDGHIRVEWNADTNAAGYQVQYCMDPSFTGSTLHSASFASRTNCNLVSYPQIGETWYVRVRAYIKDSAGTKYGTWSDASSITVGTIDNISLTQTSFVYEGRPVKVGNYLRVKSGTTALKYNVDFTLTYRNNDRPGTATVVVEGIGEYTDSIGSARYTIRTQ